jgi:hypothetical protein
MFFRHHAHRLPAAVAAVALLLGAGCAGRSISHYAPSEANARQALEAALTAWQDGQPPGEIASGPAKVQAVDSRWRAGDKLRGFEVLDEATSEDGTAAKVFSVRLDMKKPAGAL